MVFFFEKYQKSGGCLPDPTSAGDFANDGAPQPSGVKAKRLEDLAAGVWTKKSGGWVMGKAELVLPLVTAN